ncbi:hypothetical protein D3H65_13605 [Paraflavitalea soli]|uniref:Uncharacterized protein n=1 Tax=Paraflavitalea soli TaxID=2315862 RepID=A0A3B7MPN9_9BACT|nr:hypothetical protein [Paraflavitalea soli]AXY74956.1 hypothetical protein D3H65_13605 [Paraflavitalea soli]
MADKKKGVDSDKPRNEGKTSNNNMDDAGNAASTGAVLPDPEEIKLPPLHKTEEDHRTVADVNKPRDTNEEQEDHDSWDFRRNK